jgi:Rv2525c-like, glycoside hydrolase-like domain
MALGIGIDYSFGSGVTAQQIKAAGATFVARYLSPGNNPKNITKAEFNNIVGAGLNVVLVFEQGAQNMLGGKAQGIADAKVAEAEAKALGADGIPIYFAADWDATPGQQAAINDYLDGVASVITWKRTGIYGGYWPLHRAQQAGKAKYFWQTRAWSGTNEDVKNFHLFQYGSGKVGPADVDFNRSLQADYGQFKGTPNPNPTPKPTDATYKRWVADGTKSLADIANERNTSVSHLVQVSLAQENPANQEALNLYLLPGGGVMPKGLVWWSAGVNGDVRHVATGKESLVQIAGERNTTVGHLIEVSQAHLNAKNAAKFNQYLEPGYGLMPKGLVYWTGHGAEKTVEETPGAENANPKV